MSGSSRIQRKVKPLAPRVSLEFSYRLCNRLNRILNMKCDDNSHDIHSYTQFKYYSREIKSSSSSTKFFKLHKAFGIQPEFFKSDGYQDLHSRFDEAEKVVLIDRRKVIALNHGSLQGVVNEHIFIAFFRFRTLNFLSNFLDRRSFNFDDFASMVEQV